MSIIGGATLGTATFAITGNASGATNAAAQANNALASLTETVANNWWGIKNLGLAFAALPAAVAAGVGASVAAASQLQDATVNLARTSGLAGDQLDGLTQQLLDIGKIRAVPTLEIFGIAESAGALGVASEDIASFTKTVSDLVQTTDLTANDASTGLARLAALTGTTSGGFDNLASSIFGTGVETAATEKDILALSQRLAGVGAGFGLSAQEIVGWSAAIRSAGIQVQEGGTQISKTLIDIQRAVSKGGADLQGFANIAGKSAEDFKAVFSADANAGLLSIVEGLGNIISTGGDFVSFLDAVGIKEQRQVKTLLLLAQAQAQTTNENVKASNILAIADKYYNDTDRAQAAVEARAQTLSGQLQILRNSAFETSASFGSSLLPAVNSVIGVFVTLIQGISALPGPVKSIIVLFIGLVAILSAFVALPLLLGARVVIAIDAFRRLTGQAAGSAVALTEAGQALATYQAQIDPAIGKVAALNAQLQQQGIEATFVARAISFMSGGIVTSTELMQFYEEELVRVNAQTAGLGNTSSRTGALMGILAHSAIIATSVMIGLAAYTYALGQAQERLRKQTEAAQKANNDVTASMRLSGVAISETSNAALGNIDAYKKATAAATEFGISQDQVRSIIQGTASQVEFQQFLDKTGVSSKGASDSAKDLVRNVQNLRESWKQSVGDAQVAANSTDAVTNSVDALGASSQLTAEEFAKLKKTLEAQAQAAVDVIDAQLAATRSALDLQDAADKLARAQDDAAHSADRQREAELKVADAQLKVVLATQNVIDAQDALSNARDEAEKSVLDANVSLIKSQSSYYASLETVRKAEENLADLRKGPSASVFIDATNKLADAQSRLQHATLSVRDLEEQLAFMRQNGAGARDIQEAELALSDARNDVADSTKGVSDAQKALDDLRDPVKRAQAIAQAELDLQAARAESAKTLIEIKLNEAALAKARRDQANDVSYKKAQEDLAGAEIALVDAQKAARDAQHDLNDIQNGSLVREAQRAQLEYEGQILNTAKANVELKKQTALMKGETFDAGQVAHALGDELDRLVGKTDLFRQARENLAKAPNIPADQSGGGGGSDGGGDGGSGVIPDSGGFVFPSDLQGQASASFTDILKGVLSTGGIFLALEGAKILAPKMGEMFGGLGAVVKNVAAKAGLGIGTEVAAGEAAGAVAGAPVAAAGIDAGIGAAATIATVGLPALLIALVVAAVIAIAALLIKDRNWKKVGDALITGFTTAFDFLKEKFGEILSGATEFIGTLASTIIGGLAALPEQVAYWAGFAAGLIIRILFVEPIALAVEFIPLLIETIIGFLVTLPGRIFDAIVAAPGVIAGIFSAIGEFMWNIITDYGGRVLTFFQNLPGNILGFIVALPATILGFFLDVGDKLFSGFTTGAGAIIDWFIDLPGKIWDAIKDLASNVLGWFGDIGSDLWDGFKDGLGINSPSYIEKALFAIDDQMVESTANMKRQLLILAGLNVDPLKNVLNSASLKGTGLDSLAGGTTALNFATASTPTSGPSVVNNTYNETIKTDVESPADPEDIVNGYLFAKRVQKRG